MSGWGIDNQRNSAQNLQFNHLYQKELPAFLNALGIGFSKNTVTEDYQLTREKLGTGINGSVVKVIHRQSGVEGALKIINKESRNSELEVKLHAYASQCENVVRILDVYENIYRQRPCYLLIMECMPGGELFDRIQNTTQTKITERDAADIMRQIGNAVMFLHRRNIAHRDLKPENLLYSERNFQSILKLTDFGFAKEVTQKGLETPCFTPYYAAPEVLNEKQRYDMSCDVWSMGVIMYVLLCGYPPFYSDHGFSISPGMKKRIKQGEYTFPDKEWKNISLTAKDLIKRMLTVDVNKRIDIYEFMNSPWVANVREVPSTPLFTSANMMEDPDCYKETQREMESALQTMRVDNKVKIRDVKHSKNKLIERRKQKKLEAGAAPQQKMTGF